MGCRPAVSHNKKTLERAGWRGRLPLSRQGTRNGHTPCLQSCCRNVAAPLRALPQTLLAASSPAPNTHMCTHKRTQKARSHAHTRPHTAGGACCRRPPPRPRPCERRLDLCGHLLVGVLGPRRLALELGHLQHVVHLVPKGAGRGGWGTGSNGGGCAPQQREVGGGGIRWALGCSSGPRQPQPRAQRAERRSAAGAGAGAGAR